jgi:hypothetical protein
MFTGEAKPQAIDAGKPVQTQAEQRVHHACGLTSKKHFLIPEIPIPKSKISAA